MKKIRIIYHFLLTNVLYRPYCIRMGRRVIICNPILITPERLKIGSGVFIRHFGRIEAVTNYAGKSFLPVIEIQDGVSIEQNLHLTCAGKITIGKNTAIAANVTISDINHSYDDIDIAPDKQSIEVTEVIIGEDCKIYNNVVILPGTILGKHCVVGANAVVSGKIYMDYSIIVGAPARVIKRYAIEQQKWLSTDEKGNFII